MKFAQPKSNIQALRRNQGDDSASVIFGADLIAKLAAVEDRAGEDPI
jgi:hypothetical protein